MTGGAEGRSEDAQNAGDRIIRACRLGSDQKMVAWQYARALSGPVVDEVDWAAVTGEIVGRWSLSGLNRVKKMAWDLHLEGTS